MTVEAEITDRLATQLEFLADLSQLLAKTYDLGETLDEGLKRIQVHMQVEAASIFLLEQDELVCHACAGPIDIRGLSLPRGRGIVGEAASADAPILVRDVRNHPSFSQDVDESTGFITRSLIAAPLKVHDERLGAIEIINPKLEIKELFDDSDSQLLSILATALALAICNAKATAQLVDQERVKKELELGREIQAQLFPVQRDPPFPIVGVNQPAREVSGDFYDFFELDEQRLAFILADVSGKGVNAAMLGVKAGTLWREMTKQHADVGQLMAHINDALAERSSRGMFVTAACGIFNRISGWLEIANAGHPPPILLKKDRQTELIINASGPPLGAFPDMSYQAEGFDLRGSRLYIYSDGISETEPEPGKPIGEEGLAELIHQLPENAENFGLDQLLKLAHNQSQTQHDDVTFLVIDAFDISPYPSLKIALPAAAEYLKEMRDKLRQQLLDWQISADLTETLVIAVNEAGMNVIQHAYANCKTGNMCLTVECEAEKALCFTLEDQAPPINQDNIHPRQWDDIRPGGLGVNFMREIMDEIIFKPHEGNVGNTLIMRKKIADACYPKDSTESPKLK